MILMRLIGLLVSETLKNILREAAKFPKYLLEVQTN